MLFLYPPLQLSFIGDNTLRIWDISAPPAAQQTIRAHSGEVLTCDWAKYDPVSISENTPDLTPLNNIQEHQLAPPCTQHI